MRIASLFSSAGQSNILAFNKTKDENHQQLVIYVHCTYNIIIIIILELLLPKKKKIYSISDKIIVKSKLRLINSTNSHEPE